MTVATSTLRPTPLTTPVVARPAPLVVPGPLRRAGAVIGDLLTLVGIAYCIPFVILALATPVVLCVRGVLWILGMR